MLGLVFQCLHGENGILNKAQIAKKENDKSSVEEDVKLDTYNQMMDSYITTRGTSVGVSYTYLTKITSTSYQAYSVDNLEQYTALVFYLIYSTNKAVVSSITIPLERFKNTESEEGWIHLSYYDGHYYYGRISYIDNNSINGMISEVDGIEVYGVK